MNFAPILTNTGESLIYVSLLLTGMHTLFNFKIDKYVFKKNRNRVAPERNYASESGSKSSISNLSIALNRTFHIVRQQSTKMKGTFKLKPAPSPGSREAFLDFGRLNSEMVQRNNEG